MVVGSLGVLPTTCVIQDRISLAPTFVIQVGISPSIWGLNFFVKPLYGGLSLLGIWGLNVVFGSPFVSQIPVDSISTARFPRRGFHFPPHMNRRWFTRFPSDPIGKLPQRELVLIISMSFPETCLPLSAHSSPFVWDNKCLEGRTLVMQVPNMATPPPSWLSEMPFLAPILFPFFWMAAPLKMAFPKKFSLFSQGH